ncbi:MAG TPA: dipeptide epimerase [Pyrinomonadaceae bacterium]|nr:dipeptide epimerase [Pyrinomonadaceae bacterium]
MKLSWKRCDLQLKHTFRIARNARNFVPVVILTLEHDGIIAYGEASPNVRYGEDVETLNAFFSKINLEQFDSPFAVDEILNYVDSLAVGNNSAKCAVDIALHDWIGKKLDIPLWKMFGLNPANAPFSSFTIAIDEKEIVRQKVLEATDFPILKIKVGLENDREMVETIREITDKPLYVDANEGWKTRKKALESVRWLKDKNVTFIEQPMPAAQFEDIKFLRDHSEIPLIADESVLHLEDVPKLSEAFDGINIKLMKSGGIREAVKMIHTAKALKMKVMMGCMIETAVGISAAAQLSPLLDYCDLDGNVLISNDPFDGSRNIKGRLKLTEKSGLGVSPKES